MNRRVLTTGLKQCSIALLVIVLYFSVLLLPNWFPRFAGGAFFFWYLLSLPLVMAAVGLLGVWGLVGLIITRLRGRQPRERHRTYVVFSIAVALIFLAILGLNRAIPGGLPWGSQLLKFDERVWQDPKSSVYVKNDITPRQKMLKDVVENVLPGKTREQIEQALGPSLDTPYFQSTGRDLIYRLGLERDLLFAIDSEWLLIWLDDSGNFSRYEVATD